jgi:hypothetical protein
VLIAHGSSSLFPSDGLMRTVAITCLLEYAGCLAAVLNRADRALEVNRANRLLSI